MKRFTKGWKKVVEPLPRPMPKAGLGASAGDVRAGRRRAGQVAAVAADVVRDDHAGFFSSGPEGLPGRHVHLVIHGADQEVDLPQADLGGSHDFLGGGFGVVGEHLGDRQDAGGRSLGEVGRPIVVDLDAGDHQVAVREGHAEDGREHHGRFDTVAVHVGQAQLGCGGTQRVKVCDTAAVERDDGRFLRANQVPPRQSPQGWPSQTQYSPCSPRSST